MFASHEALWEMAYAMGGPSLSETTASAGIVAGGGMEEEGGLSLAELIAINTDPIKGNGGPDPGESECNRTGRQGCGHRRSSPSRNEGPEVVKNICVFDWWNPVGWVCGAVAAGKEIAKKV